MIVIRLMEPGDVDAVRAVEAESFGAWHREAKGRQKDLPKRTRKNILTLLERDPEGCFVAVEGSRPVGFIFSRTWGSVGWFGTFGVLPECQGGGIGQRLVAASVDYLKRDPDRVIGLETMPESAYNLGFYLNQGFEPRFLVLQLTRPVDDGATAGPPLARWSELGEAGRDRRLAELRTITDRIRPGLDYAKEVLVTDRHNLGDTLFLLRDDRVVGACTVLLIGKREGEETDQAAVQVLVMDPQQTSAAALADLMAAAQTLARERGMGSLLTPANARHTWAVRQLLQLGFRVQRARVCMVLAGTDSGPTTDSLVNLSFWAG